jgi:hypothetical protein
LDVGYILPGFPPGKFRFHSSLTNKKTRLLNLEESVYLGLQDKIKVDLEEIVCGDGR